MKKLASVNNENGLTDSSVKHKIFKSAQKLFVEKGYYSTSIPDIVKDAGVSTGAIYHHYSSKEELAREIHETAVKQFLTNYNRDVKSNDSIFEKIRSYISMLFRWAEDDPIMVRYLIHGRPKEILDKPLSVCSEEGLSVLLEIINSGIQKEEIKVMNPFLAAAILSGSIVRMIDLRIDGLIEHSLVEYIESFAYQVWLSLKV